MKKYWLWISLKPSSVFAGPLASRVWCLPSVPYSRRSNSLVPNGAEHQLMTRSSSSTRCPPAMLTRPTPGSCAILSIVSLKNAADASPVEELHLYGLDFAGFWMTVRHANYWWLIPGIAVYFGAVWARTWRWDYMLRPLPRPQ